ncbi:hypothetical protein E1A91_A13G084500v1 [Gossypium mustelinum]|uniref:Uncharacterized protein n=1 Tax=Gossypium mustelinum TaxID=34275 RepID=A0A5D2WEX4_GOSMU|nr:hypothetical protein E1A91_A13G084500v1 [Gossypium mustelinum]
MLEICPSSLCRINSSYTWWSINLVWETFRLNICWSIGNGRSVNFLMDNWMSRLGSFHRYLRQSTVVPMEAKVSNVTDPNGGWIEMY